MMMDIVSLLIPVMVAVTTAIGAITVAKVQRMQNYMKTNHGTAGLGDATDKILDQVEKISLNQHDILLAIDSLRSRDSALETRMTEIEKTRSRMLSQMGSSKSGGDHTVVRKRWWTLYRKAVK